MAKKNIYLILLSIFILAVFAGNLIYPNYFNKAVDFVNGKIGANLPHFWNVPFRLGLDLQGGTQLIYEADLSTINKADRSKKMDELRDIIERRVNIYGVSEPVIQIQGENRLIVELAGVKDVKEAIKMIGETPYLEFREKFSPTEQDEAITKIPEDQITSIIEQVKQSSGKDVTKDEVLNIIKESFFKTTELTGEYLKSAEVVLQQSTNKIEISLQFTDAGAKIFEQITERNIGKPLAIYLDGMSIIDTNGDGKITSDDLYAPVVQGKISGGKAVITGDLDLAKAKQIAQRLNSGALPVKIGEPISQQTVGPTLGKISLEKSLFAGAIGFLAVIIFMVIFYRLPGLLASIALLIYIILNLTVFKLVPVTLTLAGIAGFLLSVGMAVDANILIFSRIREELSSQRTFPGAVEEGFRRAWPSIRDSNFNSLIVCAILFIFAASFIRGFALTLAIGIGLSLFSAIFITRAFIRVFIGSKLENKKWLW
jgi:preprotein translocase subunit SecD